MEAPRSGLSTRLVKAMRDDAIATAVRLVVLQYRADGRSYVTLTDVMWRVMRQPQFVQGPYGPASLTLKSRKALRGKVQVQLAKLAQQGIMYTRRNPEPAVQPYEHCETDKWFKIRIPQMEAVELLELCY